MRNVLFNDFKVKLIGLDVNLNPAADDKLLASLCRAVGGNLHSDITALYKSFNGFANEDFESKSLVGVWNIEKIVSSERKFFRNGMMPFADFCLDMDIYCCSWSNPNLPVYSTNRRREMSSSYYDFWSKLISGTFDRPM